MSVSNIYGKLEDESVGIAIELYTLYCKQECKDANCIDIPEDFLEGKYKDCILESSKDDNLLKLMVRRKGDENESILSMSIINDDVIVVTPDMSRCSIGIIGGKSEININDYFHLIAENIEKQMEVREKRRAIRLTSMLELMTLGMEQYTEPFLDMFWKLPNTKRHPAELKKTPEKIIKPVSTMSRSLIKHLPKFRNKGI